MVQSTGDPIAGAVACHKTVLRSPPRKPQPVILSSPRLTAFTVLVQGRIVRRVPKEKTVILYIVGEGRPTVSRKTGLSIDVRVGLGLP